MGLGREVIFWGRGLASDLVLELLKDTTCLKKNFFPFFCLAIFPSHYSPNPVAKTDE